MPPRKLPPTEQVIAEYRSGLSTGQLAEKYNVSPVTVVGCLRRAGEPRRTGAEAAALRERSGRGNHASYWKGKKQPPEMVEKRAAKTRGPNHYMWKDGKSRRPYRSKVAKEACETCGKTDNLGIHHRDFDHYNNADENLGVLCVGCHMSLHKQAYWDAIHAGEEPPRSNGPVGWEHSKE